MKQLAKLLVLILLAGSVQGQNAGDVKVMTGDGGFVWEAPYVDTTEIGTPACRGTDPIKTSNPFDSRIRDGEYWCSEYHPCLHLIIGPCCEHWNLYRRLDRWYLDTVQVCDTVVLSGGCHAEWVDDRSTMNIIGNTMRYVMEVTCRDTTIYKQKIEKVTKEWLMPGESK